MAGAYRLQPDAAARVIASVGATEVPARPYGSALDALAAAAGTSPEVAQAIAAFDSKHRSGPARVGTRIDAAVAAARSVVDAIVTGDDRMAADTGRASTVFDGPTRTA